jgi:threonine/homoserine/homoserine lactone efflux protein
MIGLENLLLFIPVALLLIATPGPDFVLVSTTTLAKGSRAGIAACLGICAGVVCHSALAGMGVSGLLVKHPLLFEMVRWLGAGYLLYLSCQAFVGSPRGAGRPAVNPGVAKEKPYFWVGFFTNLLNPKVLVFTSLMVIQFVDLSRGNIFWQFLQLGFVYSFLTLICYTGLAILTDKLKSRVAPSPKFKNFADKILGAMFVGFALRLVLMDRP